MSFGPIVSGKSRTTPVHYRIGEIAAPQQWHQRRVGWFGYTVLIAAFGLFGALSTEARQLLLTGNGQFNYQTNAPTGADAQASPLKVKGPAAALNIVDLQPLLNSWSKQQSPTQWGIAVRSLTGPAIDATVRAKDLFESRAVYRVYLAITLYNQFPKDDQYKKTVKVNGAVHTVAACIERMLAQDDTACTDALGAVLDTDAAAAMLASAGIEHTVLSTSTRTAHTTVADTAALYAGLNGSIISTAQQKLVQKYLEAQRADKHLVISCPGCSTVGVSDYGVGRLESAGIVEYSKGSYVLVAYANGGNKEHIAQLTGKIQQHILEATTIKQVP